MYRLISRVKPLLQAVGRGQTSRVRQHISEVLFPSGYRTDDGKNCQLRGCWMTNTHARFQMGFECNRLWEAMTTLLCHPRRKAKIVPSTFEPR